MQYSKMQVFQAPMDGYTDFALREVLATESEYRPNRLFTEFVNVEAINRNIKNTEKILLFSANQEPISAQLFGKNPESFYYAVKKVIEMGYKGIDINMGCPARKIAGKDEGAGLIKNKPLVKKIIDSCRIAITESGRKNICFSVKTRLGYEKDTAEDWISFLDDLNLDFITIHGRTFAQGYKGVANWDRIGEIAKLCKTPIVGNGDILTIEQAFELQNKYDIYGTMIARNLSSFFGEDRISICLEYLKLHERNLMKYYKNEKFAVISTRKVILLLLKNIQDIKNVKSDLMKSEKYSNSIKILDRFYEK